MPLERDELSVSVVGLPSISARVRNGLNGASVAARVAIRERLRPGAAFLIEGTRRENANSVLTGGAVEVRPK